MLNILAIGGSDPSSGAGIQADIRAASALGDHCFCVVTAITAQNTSTFVGTEPVSPVMIKRQIESVLADHTVDAVSIGMVYDSATISKIRTCLKGVTAPVIVDPVMVSTTGGVLLKEAAISSMKKLLLPIAHTVTPNVREAEMLSSISIRGLDDLKDAAKKITALGAKNAVITGCELEVGRISDFVFDGSRYHIISGRKMDVQTHGSGCNFAIALSHAVAQKKDIVAAVRLAKEFTFEAIRGAKALGRGVMITDPKKDVLLEDLAAAIAKFQEMSGAASLIPEVQTNFVYAKPDAESAEGVAGVLGRIVKVGDRVAVAGGIQYGGSRHVGAAVLAMRKRFPKIRSAVNIKFDEATLKKMRRAGMKIKSYDRTEEPHATKSKENGTVSWGIESAVKKSSSAPDAVYHTGDIGKEPMIIVFGRNPRDVIAKLKFLDS